MAESDDPNRLRTIADELDDAADEITDEHHVHIHPPKGSKLEAVADETGRLKAISISDDEPTPTDPGRKPISVAPKSGIPGVVAAVGHGAARIVQAVNNVYALLALTLLVAAFIAWLRLRR